MTTIVVSAGMVARGQALPRTLKLATLAPAGSVWDKQLKDMAVAWQRTGTVRIRVLGGGQLGDEPEIAQSIRSRRPDPEIAALTAVGLCQIDRAFAVFGVPFFFQSYDELYAVLHRMTPMLSSRLDAQGLILLGWGHVGWTQVFTTRPITTLPELKRLKLWTSAGDEDMLRWYHEHGFAGAAARPMTDIPLGLTSGAIEALPTSPTILSASQWYKQAKYMLDIGIAPIIGAVVVAKPTWASFADADRRVFADAARAMERQLEVAVPQQDKTSVDEMVRRGLLTVTKSAGPEWRTEARALSSSMQGAMVPPDVYAIAVREREAFRQQRKPS